MHHSSPKACTFSVSLQRRSPGTSVPTDASSMAFCRPSPCGWFSQPPWWRVTSTTTTTALDPSCSRREGPRLRSSTPLSLFLGVQFVTPRSVRVGRSRELEAVIVAYRFTTPHRRSSRSCGLLHFPRDLDSGNPAFTMNSLPDWPLVPGTETSPAFDAACYRPPNPFRRRSPRSLASPGQPLVYPRRSSRPDSLRERGAWHTGAILWKLRHLAWSSGACARARSCCQVRAPRLG
jgi:hypothetical protein